jgi:hypothetical protein
VRSDLSSSERELANQCVYELTSITNEQGLPIGPALSHALANVFLEDFDTSLSKEFGHSYFRYVDDIAIVVPRSDVNRAQSLFERVVCDHNLKSHPGKQDIVDGSDWSIRMQRKEKVGVDSFGLLLSDLRRYLAHNVADYDRVKSMFQAEGFTLPFSRLRSVASCSNRFRRFLQGLGSKSNGLFGTSIPRPPALLDRAKFLRQDFYRRLGEATGCTLPSNDLKRRWALQEIRYYLNRSLYLFPVDRRQELLDVLPDCQELIPSRTVLNALITGDASELTKYPGLTVSAFCELWTETTDKRPTLNWSSVPSREERDSAIVLALCGLATPPAEWTQQLKEESSRVMVNLAAGQRPNRRTFDDFSYADEMESLFLKPNIDIHHLLHSRFDDTEDVYLPTLGLGGNQSMS